MTVGVMRRDTTFASWGSETGEGATIAEVDGEAVTTLPTTVEEVSDVFVFEAHPKHFYVSEDGEIEQPTPGVRGYNPNLHLARSYGEYAAAYVKPNPLNAEAFAARLLPFTFVSEQNGFRFTSAMIPVKMLTIEGFQREPDGISLRAMVRSYQPKKLKPLLVNYISAERIFSVIDGQTRATYLLRSQGPDTLCDATIYFDLSTEDEVEVFNSQGDARHVSLFQRLHAIAWGGEPVGRAKAQQLFDLMDELGIGIKAGVDKTGQAVRGVDALITMRNKWGIETLALALKTIKTLYHGTPGAYDAAIIKGMTTFLGLYGNHPNFKMNQFIQQVQTQTLYSHLPAGAPSSILRTAEQLSGGKTTQGIARVFFLLYNHKKKSPKVVLPPWDEVTAKSTPNKTKQQDLGLASLAS